MMTQVRFRCYYCHRTHTLDSTAAGKKGRCLCGKLMVVPEVPADLSPGAGDDSLPVAAPPQAGSSDTADTEALSRNLPQLDLGEDPAPERGPQESPTSALLGTLQIFFSLPILALGFAHVFHDELVQRDIAILPDPAYLSIPAPLWSTLIFTFGGLLLLDGLRRVYLSLRGR